MEINFFKFGYYMKRSRSFTHVTDEKDEKNEKRARSESPSRSSLSSLRRSRSLPRFTSLTGTSQATSPSILQTITSSQPLQTNACSSQINVTCSAPCNPSRSLTPDELRSFFGSCIPSNFYILYVGAHGNHVSHGNPFKSIRVLPIEQHLKRVSIIKLGVAGFSTKSKRPGKGSDYSAKPLLMENCFEATPRNNVMAELQLSSDPVNGIGNISLMKVDGDTISEIAVYINDEWNIDKRPLFLSDIYQMFNQLLLEKEGDQFINGILYLTACEPRKISKGIVTSDMLASERETKNTEEMKTPRGTPTTDPVPLSDVEKAKMTLWSATTVGSARDALRRVYKLGPTNRVFKENIDREITTNTEILEKIKSNMEKAFDDLNIVHVSLTSQPIQSGQTPTIGGFGIYSNKSHKRHKSPKRKTLKRHKSLKRHKTNKRNKLYL